MKSVPLNKVIVGVVALAIIVGAGSFYGGMQYAAAKSPRVSGRAFAGNFASSSAAQRQGRGAANRMGGGFIGGEIIAKDGSSITLKLPDGGSKIVFFASSTAITKSATSTPSDLAIGEQVMVTGSASQDGSIAAQMVQIRPAGLAPMARPQQ